MFVINNVPLKHTKKEGYIEKRKEKKKNERDENVTQVKQCRMKKKYPYFFCVVNEWDNHVRIFERSNSFFRLF